MQPCKRQVGLPTGSPPACAAVPAGASLKRKIPGGSGDRVTRFLRQRTKENRQLRVGGNSETLVGLRSMTSLYRYSALADPLYDPLVLVPPPASGSERDHPGG